MKNESVCFTGHRILPVAELPALQKALAHCIEHAVNLRMRSFYCGGARGFDMLAGFMVLALKRQHPEIKLIMVLPCRNQDEKWNDDERSQYHQLLAAADRTICLSESYYSGCMFKRNQYLVDHSTMCIAYLTHAKTGTAQTVRLAKERGLTVYNLALQRISP